MFWKSLKSIALVIGILALVIAFSGTAGAQEEYDQDRPPPPDEFVEGTDYGDAPSPPYPTATHYIQRYEWLGDGVTKHDKSNPMPPAWTGDKCDDGVEWGPIVPGSSKWWIKFTVTTKHWRPKGFRENVEIWVDWDGKDGWEDNSDEQVVDWFDEVDKVTGTETFKIENLTVPADVKPGTQLAIRVRLAYRAKYSCFKPPKPYDADLHPWNPRCFPYAEWYGEVEDYLTEPVGGTVPVELSSFTASTEREGVALRWITGSETENLGYHVYRSLREAGEYQKITPALIEGGGSSRTTRTYRFVDRDVQPGARYFYKLEQLDFDGTKETYGPVVGKATMVQASTWGAVKSLLR